MTTLLLCLLGALGTALLASAWAGAAAPVAATENRTDARPQVRHRPAIPPRELIATSALTAAGAAAGAFVLFGAPVAAALAAALGAAIPVATVRARAARRLAAAQECWPRLIEELRVLTGSAGRSIPQALFDVGARAPDELRPAFETAHLEWRLSTDFARTLDVLKHELGDSTADAVCETLLVSYELGGTHLDRRLADLAEDRAQDLAGRKDARAKQAGVRFARRFVLLVPLGMAAVGLSVGTGRAAYGTPTGQAAVALGTLVLAACWVWAGRLMRLPRTPRVFGP